MADLTGAQPKTPPPASTLSELSCLKTDGEVPVNDFGFSPFQDLLLAAAQDDGLLSLFDIPSRSQIHHFSEHSMSSTALTFSPVSHLLLISVGLDRSILFYDTQQRLKVNAIHTPHQLTSLAFNQDGFTIAVGTSNSLVLVYDLRKQSEEPLATLLSKSPGQPVSFLQFKHPQQVQHNENIKTMEQIREEARKNIEGKRKHKIDQARQSMQKTPEDYRPHIPRPQSAN
jgi:WD40 repeat protein